MSPRTSTTSWSMRERLWGPGTESELELRQSTVKLVNIMHFIYHLMNNKQEILGRMKYESYCVIKICYTHKAKFSFKCCNKANLSTEVWYMRLQGSNPTTGLTSFWPATNWKDNSTLSRQHVQTMDRSYISRQMMTYRPKGKRFLGRTSERDRNRSLRPNTC
jgi:hypothetical protein